MSIYVRARVCIYIYMTNSDYDIIFNMIQKGFFYLGFLFLHICFLPQYTPSPPSRNLNEQFLGDTNIS